MARVAIRSFMGHVTRLGNSMAESREQSADSEFRLVLNLTPSTARELVESNAGAEQVESGAGPSKACSERRSNAVPGRRRNTSCLGVGQGVDAPQCNNQLRITLSMKISRPCTTNGAPGMNLEFQADASVLKAFGEDTLAAFESGVLEQLPASKLKERMESLAGIGPRRADISHYDKTSLVFDATSRKEAGVGPSDELLIISLKPYSLFMKNDYDAKKNCYVGRQEPAITMVARDIFDIGRNRIIMSPSYWWNQQLIRDIPPDSLEKLYYDQRLPRLEDDGFTRLGDVFCVGHRISGKQGAVEYTIRDWPLECISGLKPAACDEIVLAGKDADIPVRTNMGVSYTFDECPPDLRDALTGGGNPGLKAGHGFVQSIGENAEGEVELTLGLLLGKANLPQFLVWERVPQDAVFQSNLVATIPMRWVVSSFLVQPIPLSTLPAHRPEERYKLGDASCPFERNVYVTGHLEFIPGELVQPETPPDVSLFSERYKNEGLKAFSLLSDYAARGGPGNDWAFKEHADWKARYVPRMKAVPHCRPTLELHRVEAFPPVLALRTLYESQRLTAFPKYGPFLHDLHTGIRRFAASKAKKVKKSSTGSACVMNVNFSGSILLQLVYKYAAGSKVHFKEGKVEAVLEDFAQAEKLFGSVDGEFNLGGGGIVQFHAPITLRWTLYNPTTRPEDPGHLASEGKAEVEFLKYVVKDRHGGELGGSLSYDGEGSGGAPKGNYPCSSHPIDDPCYGCQSMPRRHWW